VSKRATVHTETLVILAVVAVAAHHIVGLDWPWAIVAGAAASLVARAVFHRRPAAPP
jgi:preprotein translocase subunit SecE